MHSNLHWAFLFSLGQMTNSQLCSQAVHFYTNTEQLSVSPILTQLLTNLLLYLFLKLFLLRLGLGWQGCQSFLSLPACTQHSNGLVSCSSLVNSKPIWLHQVKTRVKFEAQKYFCCLHIDRIKHTNPANDQNSHALSLFSGQLAPSLGLPFNTNIHSEEVIHSNGHSCWSLLYSAILCSRADSLHFLSHVILMSDSIFFRSHYILRRYHPTDLYINVLLFFRNNQNKNPCINVLFYICSQKGDIIRQQKRHRTSPWPKWLPASPSPFPAAAVGCVRLAACAAPACPATWPCAPPPGRAAAPPPLPP